MSWLFSQALVAEFSAATCSAGEPSAPLSVMPTPHKFWRIDKTVEPSDLSRFGLTCAVSTADRGEALLTWFRGAFHARTSALQGAAPASTASAAECGPTWRGSLARFDPSTSLWRTAQPSLLGDSDECSVTWPRSGMTAGGQCWEQPTLAPPTSATGSGLWLPKPCTVDTGAFFNQSQSAGAALRPTLGAMAKHGLWPTPTASLGTNGGRVTPTKAREGGTLIEALSARTLWPTPTVCGNYNRKGASKTSGDGLATAVQKCATPTARDWRSGKASQATHDKNSRPLSEQVGGLLNPAWVEWLMGWPIGWTELEPSATDKSLPVPLPRGESSLEAVEP